MAPASRAPAPRHRRLWPAAAAALGLALVLAPHAAEACAVCFSGKNDATRVAFIVTTAFMTLLPFALLGSAALWLRRRLREHEAAQEAHRRAAAPVRRGRAAVSA